MSLLRFVPVLGPVLDLKDCVGHLSRGEFGKAAVTGGFGVVGMAMDVTMMGGLSNLAKEGAKAGMKMGAKEVLKQGGKRVTVTAGERVTVMAADALVNEAIERDRPFRHMDIYPASNQFEVQSSASSSPPPSSGGSQQEAASAGGAPGAASSTGHAGSSAGGTSAGGAGDGDPPRKRLKLTSERECRLPFKVLLSIFKAIFDRAVLQTQARAGELLYQFAGASLMFIKERNGHLVVRELDAYSYRGVRPTGPEHHTEEVLIADLEQWLQRVRERYGLSNTQVFLYTNFSPCFPSGSDNNRRGETDCLRRIVQLAQSFPSIQLYVGFNRLFYTSARALVEQLGRAWPLNLHVLQLRRREGELTGISHLRDDDERALAEPYDADEMTLTEWSGETEEVSESTVELEPGDSD